ncbi:MAG: hypothetical protein JWQ10_290 [Herbaspirillum sp.]|nr:hypothetical protein [Herbaspirillum sp.]
MGIRPFTDVLRDMRFGETLDELGEEFNKLVQAVENTGRAGEMTLQIKLKPSTAGAIELTDLVKVKLPAPQKGTSLFFATPEGNLVRNDPRQKEIPGLKEVESNSKPLKDVAHG